MSALIALLIAIPSLYLMLRGVKDAGEETMRPKPEHNMYGGIYIHIRHPQAAGELPLWWTVAYVPVWYYFCVAEERDLLIRYGTAYQKYREKTGFWLPKRKNRRNAA